MLERVANGQEALSQRFAAFEVAFGRHCAVEEAAAKRRESRVPLWAALSSVASVLVAGTALALQFLR